MNIPQKFEAGALTDAAKSTSFARDVATDLAALAATITAASSAAISAVAATAPSAVATADGSDPTTTQALANALKVQVNVLVTAVVELRTLAGTVRTLLNELRTNAEAAPTILTVNQ